MREPENNSPEGVVRAKRLEIVDDEGKVRAMLGTDEQGVASLSIFDASGRLQASLDASDIPKQTNGLAVFDESGRLQIGLGASAIPEQGGGLSFFGMNGMNGELRVGMGPHENGQVGLSLSAGQKDRDVQMSAGYDGDLYLTLSEKDTPIFILAGLANHTRTLRRADNRVD